jgi:hypothetical protein
MSGKDKQIVPFDSLKNKVQFEKPSVPEGFGLTKKTFTEITNAVDAHVYLDNQARLWIATDALPKILRTKLANTNYILDKIASKHKASYDGKGFVRGSKVLGQISEEIEKAGLEKRGHYLRLSEECLKSIRDSDTAKSIRGAYEAYWREEKKKLKKRRIKKYKIEVDELTGESLEIKTAEFSHIRSSSMYKEFSLNIENGLIVNKGTHDIITAQGVNDEEELLALCSIKGWNESWYEIFKKHFS